MDSSVPNIIFDSNGVCNYCQAAEDRLAKEVYIGNAHKSKLSNLIAEIKKNGVGKQYDCIIGVSGGVDSSYVAYLVKKKYGLRPLAIHFDNGWNSELAVQNIEQLLKVLEIDLHTNVVDWEEFKDLQLSFLKASVANSEIPTDHAIVALMYRLAAKYDVRYIISGGNLATESIMPDIWMHDAKDLRFLKAIHHRFGNMTLKTFPMQGYIKLAWNVLVKRIRYVGLLNYIDYNKEEAMRILERDLGWRKYEAKHFESIYTRFFQGYLLPIKFKMDKRRPHLSSLIVSGQLSRDDAIKELEMEVYNKSMAGDDIDYICQKFGLSDAEFETIMRSPVKQSDDYPNSERLLKTLAPVVRWIKQIATGRSLNDLNS
jgi:N-acetyl sugar amidotransferase